MGRLTTFCVLSGQTGNAQRTKPEPADARPRKLPGTMNLVIPASYLHSLDPERIRKLREFVPWQSYRKCSRGLYRYCKRERGRWHLARRVVGGMRHNAYDEEGKATPLVDPLRHLAPGLPAGLRGIIGAAPNGSILEMELLHDSFNIHIMTPAHSACELGPLSVFMHVPVAMDDGVPFRFLHEDSPLTGMQAHPDIALTTHGLGAETRPHDLEAHIVVHAGHHAHHGHQEHARAGEPEAFGVFFRAFLRIPGLDPYAVCTGGHFHAHHEHHGHHPTTHHGLHHPHPGHYHSVHAHGHNQGTHHAGHNAYPEHQEHRQHSGHPHEHHQTHHSSGRPGPGHHSRHGHHNHGANRHDAHHSAHHAGHNLPGHRERPTHHGQERSRHEHGWSLRFFDAVWGKKVGIDPTAIAEASAAKAEAAAAHEASKPPEVSRYHVLGRRERRFVNLKVTSAADAMPPQ